MDKNKKVLKNIQRFASEHKLIVEEKGECGFGRPCVGLLSRSGNYLDYNPMKDNGEFEHIWPDDERLCPPHELVPNAYHKHDCMAVLTPSEDYDTALVELNEWIKYLESKGKVSVHSYPTGATGLQAVISGFIGYAVRIDAPEDDNDNC